MRISPVEPDALRRHDPFVRAVADRLAALAGDARPGLASAGYLAGGVAVRCYADARTTDDVDVFFRGARLLVPPNTTFEVRSGGRAYSLTFDQQYTPDFGLLHPDFEERAVRLAGEGGGFRLSVLHPVDLALTKVVRFEAHDRADIEALARTGTFDAEALLLLGEEAMGYMVGDARFARLNLRDAAGLVGRSRGGAGEAGP
jgi:hypothetical protein